MHTPGQIEQQINKLIASLVNLGLCDLQFYAFRRPGAGNLIEITFAEAAHISTALKATPYREIYDYFMEKDAYNVRMLDGSLIQMMYLFADRELQKHRLAFFPPPAPDEFQSIPEFQEDDGIHAARFAVSSVPFPLRFDYDASNERHREIVHAKSHLTLGQYENCRIPVTAPMTPRWFIDFILRNFYDTAARSYADELPAYGRSFAQSIFPVERKVVHLAVPA